MSLLSPDDEITGSEDIIQAEDVKARIGYLKAHDCHDPQPDGEGCDSVYACPSCYGDAEEELAHLTDLLSDFGEYVRYAVNDDYMTDYAQEEVESIDNITPESIVYSFVDWAALADQLKIDMQSIEFRGSTYWMRG